MSTAGFVTLLANSNRQILPDVLKRKFRNLVFEGSSPNTVLPTEGGLKAGAKYLVQLEASHRANAIGDELISDDATDVQLVDVGLDETTYKVVTIKRAYSYTYEEMESIQSGAMDVTSERALACRRVIAEISNRLGAFGAPGSGLSGMLNNDQVPYLNSSFDFFTAEPAEIADFFREQITAVSDETNQVERIDTILLPDAQYDHMMFKLIPGTSSSILTFLSETLKAHGHEVKMHKITECKASQLERAKVLPAGTNKDRLVFYSKTKETLCRKVEPVKKLPEEYSNSRYKTVLRQRVSDVMVHYPLSMRYVDVPTAS
jgi:hypothetical protein